MVCLSVFFFFVQSSTCLSYRILLEDGALNTLVQDNVLENSDQCSVDEYCIVPLENGLCPKILGDAEEWESQCAKCNVDPSNEPNHLHCKTCALDNTLRLPMCTSCDGSWISLVWANLFSQDPSWDAPRPAWSSENSTRRWLCVPHEIHPNEVPALCSEDPHEVELQRKRQAWWAFQDKNGNYQPKLVHLSELKHLRKSSRGYPDHVFIKMRVFPDEKNFLKDNEVRVIKKNRAEMEYVFQVRKTDSWLRHATYLKNHPELMPVDDDNMVWYLDDAFENDRKQLGVQVGFVKNVRDGNGEVLGKKSWEKVPKMRFTELAMQALGLCFDFWLKDRLPGHDLFTRSAASIWYRVSQFFDHADFLQSHQEFLADTQTHIDSNRCPAGEYCTYGPHNAACNPPGRCLPCNQDDDGRENGLLCSECGLSTLAGVRSSVPSCQIDGKSTCNERQTAMILIDDTEVRRRWYCRPEAYTPGKMPMLCKPAEQKGFYVASPGEFWQVQRNGNSTLGKDKRVRFLPIKSRMASDELSDSPTRIIDAYIMFFPRTESLREESVTFHAGSSYEAEQMLSIQFKSTDNLLYVPGTKDFDDEHAMFKYHGKRKVVRESFHTLSFNQQVTDLNTGEPLVGESGEENMVFYLSDDALLALTACYDSFINDGLPTDPSPLSGLRERLALNTAEAYSASIVRSRERTD